MNKNSNGYIIIYSAVMVVVVALALSCAALKLQPLQNANAENEMKGAILTSVGLEGDALKVKDKTTYINDLYTKYITDEFVVDAQGERVGDVNAFELLANLKAEYEKPASERLLPVFVSRDDAGTERYVLPLRGSGLWGPVWGYVALNSDWDTIYGAVFDHQGETPGLGAEIATPAFGGQFEGKTIFSNGEFTSVNVVKGRGGDPAHSVDAISGGTITSRGVEAMLRDNLTGYLPYIIKVKNGN
jgi:Na+-transporting NADH:ubiquinone oxidoreductase subunit C